MTDPIEVRGLSETKKFLATLAGQIPYATSLALNRTGKQVIEAQKEEMRRTFDRPTPYTLGGLFQTGATKQKLETRTRIKSPSPAEAGQTEKRYIGVQIWGGRRLDKASEVFLKQRKLLPVGYQMVPGRGVRLNKYGNVTGGYMQSLLKALQIGYTRGKAKPTQGDFFINKKGIFRKMKRSGEIRPIFLFVKRPEYDPLFDYYRVSEETFAKKWDEIFGDAIDQALRTAK